MSVSKGDYRRRDDHAVSSSGSDGGRAGAALEDRDDSWRRNMNEASSNYNKRNDSYASSSTYNPSPAPSNPRGNHSTGPADYHSRYDSGRGSEDASMPRSDYTNSRHDASMAVEEGSRFRSHSGQSNPASRHDRPTGRADYDKFAKQRAPPSDTVRTKDYRTGDRRSRDERQDANSYARSDDGSYRDPGRPAERDRTHRDEDDADNRRENDGTWQSKRPRLDESTSSSSSMQQPTSSVQSDQQNLAASSASAASKSKGVYERPPTRDRPSQTATSKILPPIRHALPERPVTGYADTRPSRDPLPERTRQSRSPPPHRGRSRSPSPKFYRNGSSRRSPSPAPPSNNKDLSRKATFKKPWFAKGNDSPRRDAEDRYSRQNTRRERSRSRSRSRSPVYARDRFSRDQAPHRRGRSRTRSPSPPRHVQARYRDRSPVHTSRHEQQGRYSAHDQRRREPSPSEYDPRDAGRSRNQATAPSSFTPSSRDQARSSFDAASTALPRAPLTVSLPTPAELDAHIYDPRRPRTDPFYPPPAASSTSQQSPQVAQSSEPFFPPPPSFFALPPAVQQERPLIPLPPPAVLLNAALQSQQEPRLMSIGIRALPPGPNAANTTAKKGFRPVAATSPQAGAMSPPTTQSEQLRRFFPADDEMSPPGAVTNGRSYGPNDEQYSPQSRTTPSLPPTPQQLMAHVQQQMQSQSQSPYQQQQQQQFGSAEPTSPPYQPTNPSIQRDVVVQPQPHQPQSVRPVKLSQAPLHPRLVLSASSGSSAGIAKLPPKPTFTKLPASLPPKPTFSASHSSTSQPGSNPASPGKRSVPNTPISATVPPIRDVHPSPKRLIPEERIAIPLPARPTPAPTRPESGLQPAFESVKREVSQSADEVATPEDTQWANWTSSISVAPEWTALETPKQEILPAPAQERDLSEKAVEEPKGAETTTQAAVVVAPTATVHIPKARFSELYERLAQVGEGTYGKVYKARDHSTGGLVAMKRIRMEAEKDGFPVTAIREIKLLQSLDHPNVVKLMEMMVSKGHVYMVFEYADHDLTGILHHPNVNFSPANLKSLMLQLLQGLDYIHWRGVLHRDLKGSNILLSKYGDLKLADFGLAKFYAKGKRNDYTNRVITQWYKPPELLFGATAYGPEVDMWSAGCIFLELFTRRPIFQGLDEIHQLDTIYKYMGTPSEETWPELTELPWYELVKPAKEIPSVFRETFSAEYLKTEAGLDLAEALLSFNPAKRPTAYEATQLPYFTSELPQAEKPTWLQTTIKGDWHEMESKEASRKKGREMRKQQQAATAAAAAAAAGTKQ